MLIKNKKNLKAEIISLLMWSLFYIFLILEALIYIPIPYSLTVVKSTLKK